MKMPLSTVLSKPVAVAVALGAGILIGSGATFWLLGRRVTYAVQRLAHQISELRREFDRLQRYIEERVSPVDLQRNDVSDFDDEEDVYEDAYDG